MEDEPMSTAEIIAGARESRGKSWERDRRPPGSACPACNSREHVEHYGPFEPAAGRDSIFDFREVGEGERYVRKNCRKCGALWAEHTPETWEAAHQLVLTVGISEELSEGLRLTAATGPLGLSEIVELALRQYLPSPLPQVDRREYATDIIRWQKDANDD